MAKMRRSIDRRPERWREVLSDAAFRRVFFPQVKPGAGVEAVVKAFVGKNQMNALKTKPMVSHAHANTKRNIHLPGIEGKKKRKERRGMSANVIVGL